MSRFGCGVVGCQLLVWLRRGLVHEPGLRESRQINAYHSCRLGSEASSNRRRTPLCPVRRSAQESPSGDQRFIARTVFPVVVWRWRGRPIEIIVDTPGDAMASANLDRIRRLTELLRADPAAAQVASLGSIPPQCPRRWFVDETYVRVAGEWRYVYRAVDQADQVIDVFVSAHRDAIAARRFLQRAIGATRVVPVEVTTDQAPVYPSVLEELLPAAWHRTDRYANNRMECDRDRLKARLRPMRRLKQDRSARVIIAGHALCRTCDAGITSWPWRTSKPAIGGRVRRAGFGDLNSESRRSFTAADVLVSEQHPALLPEVATGGKSDTWATVNPCRPSCAISTATPGFPPGIQRGGRAWHPGGRGLARGRHAGDRSRGG
jgi:hypothetical protein